MSMYDDLDNDQKTGDDTGIMTYQPQATRPMPTQGGHIAELQVLASLASGHVRDPEQMIGRARRVGARMAEAGKAMYSFPAGGGRVEGPTVQMAEALAQEWGYLWTGVRIDSVEGETVMLTAAVFDASTGSYLTRPHMATLPPAPGKFAAKAEQAARWESMQVQAGISKAIRTAILHALPGWYVEAAVVAARGYNREKMLGGKSLAEAVADTVAYFGRLGVSLAQLEIKAGAAKALWTASDVVDFRGLARAIKDGDATVDGAFPAVASSNGTASPKTSARSALGLPDHGDQPDPLAGVRPPEREAVPVQAEVVEQPRQARKPPTPADVGRAESAVLASGGTASVQAARNMAGLDYETPVDEMSQEQLVSYRAALATV